MNAPDDLMDLLTPWLPQQRWFPAKDRPFTLTEVGRVDHPGPDEAQLITHLVQVRTADSSEVVQVPLSYRTEALAQGSPLGTLGGCVVHDGPHDPSYVAALVGQFTRHDGEQPPAAEIGACSVLEGEQSNTSVIVDPAGREPLIVKVFRVVNAGRNPDVEVLGALSEAGCARVPALVGWTSGTWRDDDGREVTGDLAIATQFLTGSRDAWRVALEAATAGHDFTEQAQELGAATAEVHTSLREVLGVTEAGPDHRDALIAGLQRRVDWALSSAESLAPHRDALIRHRDALSGLDALPMLQRIHGDYHLGQVLHSPAAGWVLLDFEGEPLRPVAERTLPDLAIRDVVGMLRSFDYAAGHVALTSPEHATAATGWARDCRAAFLRGYTAVAGSDPQTDHQALFTALWLDKALYEVVYETRNRPEWVTIPLTAVTEQLDLA